MDKFTFINVYEISVHGKGTNMYGKEGNVIMGEITYDTTGLY